MSLPVDPRNETIVVAMDDNIIYGDVDGCLWNHSRFPLQTRLCLLRAALLVHLFIEQKLLEQSHLPVRHRGDLVLGHWSG